MVRLAGIEPTTPWFVAKYSIQLSYSRNSAVFYLCKNSPRSKNRIFLRIAHEKSLLSHMTAGLILYW